MLHGFHQGHQTTNGIVHRFPLFVLNHSVALYYFACCTLCVLLYYVCIAVLTLDAGLLARSQYPEGPATGHLDTGFSWFPCVYRVFHDFRA